MTHRFDLGSSAVHGLATNKQVYIGVIVLSNLTAVTFYSCVFSMLLCNAEMTSSVHISRTLQQRNDPMWPGAWDIIGKPFSGIQEHCRMCIRMAQAEVPVARNDMVKRNCSESFNSIVDKAFYTHGQIGHIRLRKLMVCFQ